MEEIKTHITDRFNFDESTGKFYWKRPPMFHGQLLGKEAGRIKTERTGKQYWSIKINNIECKRSRAVFLITHGRFPEPCVDHINGNSLDDRPCNLREASHEQNARNRKIHKKSSDLPRGVNRVGNKFIALIRHNKNQIRLGLFDTISDALEAYTSKRKEFYGEFSEY